MARKDAAQATGIRARWRITGMSTWSQDFVDTEVPAYIEFGEGGRGEFQFGYVNCGIDQLPEERNARASFTFEGFDEMSPTSGRGWAMVLSNGTLKGHIYFHNGDDSAFEGGRNRG